MTPSFATLIVEDNVKDQAAILEAFQGGGPTLVVSDLLTALQHLKTFGPALVILDVMFPQKTGQDPSFSAGQFIRAVKEVRRGGEDVPRVILVTGQDDVADLFDEVQGWLEEKLIDDIILKSTGVKVFRRVLQHKAESVYRELQQRPSAGTVQEVLTCAGIVGLSRRMIQVGELIIRYAATDAPVLIYGETGTGKELVARTLHACSNRRKKTFMTMNCSALNENRFDDEVFGHEEGSCTGAKGQRKGWFEHANGGTLFLDEVGDMPLSLQAKLLRVLQDGEVVRIGANDPIKVDVRIIAATNKDLPKEVAAGRFRSDLYFRLKVLLVSLPSLRERREEISPLVNYYIPKHSEQNHKHVSGISPDALSLLVAHDWPGNVRQLVHELLAMVIHCDGTQITEANFSEELRGQLRRPTVFTPSTPPLGKAPMMHTITKTVVQVDLVGYSAIAAPLEQGLGVTASAQLDHQIQEFVDMGLAGARVTRQEAVKRTTGDGAQLVFDTPAQAHAFADALHEAASRHNTNRAGLGKRVFRVGIATGELALDSLGDIADSAGMTIVRAARLETSAKPGEVLCDPETFAGLGSAQRWYSEQQTVAGKHGEMFLVHRATLNPEGVKDAESFTGPASSTQPKASPVPVPAAQPAKVDRKEIHNLFIRLKSHQFDQLLFQLAVPVHQWPPEALALEDRKNRLLKWAGEENRLDDLLRELRELVEGAGTHPR